MNKAKTNFDTELDALQGREQQKKGKLKIFLGMMPGVGKASAMLRAAQVEAANGRQVVVGIITWYTLPETMALMKGLPVVPPRDIKYNSVLYKEMDTKTILEMHPDIVLITNPAHVNVPGSRHLKRYHDIEEMLNNGINVYTTLSVAQLESYTDFIHELTGQVIPTLPDEFFARADDVELVDIEPDQLVKRYREGKVYISKLPVKVVETIYQEEKIAAIRKKFFQMTIDRENWHNQHVNWPSRIRARLLVPIWSDAITPQVIRRSKAMATTIDTDWVALYIETDRQLSDLEKVRLEDNIKLARQLGGTFITYTGNDLVEALIEVARRERVSHIVLGKTNEGKIAGCHETKFLKRLLKYSGHINISIICGETPPLEEKKRLFHIDKPVPGLSNKLLTVVAALLTGILCTVLDNKTGNNALPYIVMLSLFMLAAPMRASSRLVSFALALLACVVFFIPPAFTFPVDLPSDISSLLFFGLIAFINGFLTVRLRTHERETFRREKQTNALFLLTKNLSEASGIRDVVETSTKNLMRYFDVRVFFIFRDADYQLTNFKYAPPGQTLSTKEAEIAAWAFKHDKSAGRFTDVMSSGEYTYYPLPGKGLKMGVLVAKQEKSFSGKDDISWYAFLSQIAQSLEHQYLEITAHRTNLLNESDKLYKTLFNSISHELRIPISTITGASDLLLTSAQPEHIRTELYGEILGASNRLNRLVENLLNMSRLESGRISAHPDWCDIRDLFNRVAGSLEEELRLFCFELVVPESMPLVRIDYGLIEQVVYNLLYNATQYAPEGTVIRLIACYENGFLIIQVTDRGPGFDADSLKNVFNKFWRSQGGKSGGLGLGLSIVKGYVEAHNGTVYVANRKNGGARFTIMILTEKTGLNANVQRMPVMEEVEQEKNDVYYDG